jgi:hypothetical protein
LAKVKLRNTREVASGIENLDRDFGKMFDSARSHKEKPDRDLEDMYTKYPSLAPTATERAAQSLRDRADEIEARAAEGHFSAINRGAIADARRCEQVITRKLQTM